MKLPDKHKAPDCIGDYASTDSYNEGFEEGFNSCLDEVVAMNSDTLTIPLADLERLQRDAERMRLAIFAEAATWKGDHRGVIFLALSGVASRMGVAISKNDLWDAAIAASKGTDNGEGVNHE